MSDTRYTYTEPSQSTSASFLSAEAYTHIQDLYRTYPLHEQGDTPMGKPITHMRVHWLYIPSQVYPLQMQIKFLTGSSYKERNIFM